MFKKLKEKKEVTEEPREENEEMEELPELDVFEDNTSESVTKFKQSIPAMSVPAKSKLSIIIIAFFIGVFTGSLGALYYSQRMMPQEKQEQVQVQQDKRSIEEKVLDFVRFDTNEKPIVAMIKDSTSIKNMPVYTFAKSGDVVLVYDDMTLIFDEKNNRVVSLVPQVLLERLPGGQVKEEVKDADDKTSVSEVEETGDEESAEEADDESEIKEDEGEDSQDIDKEIKVSTPQDITVEVRNGTAVAGLAGKISTEIETSFGYATKAANASKKDYEEYLIIDLSGGTLSEDIENIRDKYSITKVLTDLPEGESASDADIVVILGK